MIKTTLKIKGMMCGMCEAHVNDAIRNEFNVKKVTSSHSKGETEIISADKLDETKLGKTVEELGYTLESVKTEAYAKKRFFGIF